MSRNLSPFLKWVVLTPLAVSLVLMIGCDIGKPTKVRSKPQDEEPALAQEAESQPAPAPQPKPAAKPEPVAKTEPTPEPKPEVKMEVVKAEPGVTGKADFAKDGANSIMSPITVPVGEYFQARDRAAFDMQIPKAMQLYKAMNGKAPATHEEFMSKIVDENSIILPQLPDGRSYLYDPKTETLNVVRPAKR